MNDPIAMVYQTDEYSLFRDLIGNRDVKEGRKRLIMESIQDVGYINNPIIVNEKYEVIDGQGRLAACEELGIPVSYVMVQGIGVRECMRLNRNMKNWTSKDYIDSYAEQGKQSFKYLKQLLETHGAGIQVTMYAATGYQGGSVGRKIEAGDVSISGQQFFEARLALQFLERVNPYIEQMDGRKETFRVAMVYAYKEPRVDNERLVTAISKNYQVIPGVVNFTQALDEISAVYNKGLKAGGRARIYLRMWHDQEKYR